MYFTILSARRSDPGRCIQIDGDLIKKSATWRQKDIKKIKERDEKREEKKRRNRRDNSDVAEVAPFHRPIIDERECSSVQG